MSIVAFLDIKSYILAVTFMVCQINTLHYCLTFSPEFLTLWVPVKDIYGRYGLIGRCPTEKASTGQEI